MYGMYYSMFDPTIILVIIGSVICIAASSRVKSTFNKYSKVRAQSGLRGFEVAERILRQEGLYEVRIEHIKGSMTDHYDPRTKTVRLSDTVYNSNSVAAIGVAAHECGHAIQHHKMYAPLSMRAAILPVANFGSKFAWILIIIGLIIGGSSSSLILTAGIFLFSAVVLFQLVTLPVEFDASKRAVAVLGNTGILSMNEVDDTKKVLSAAAMTYVASAAASVLQLLRIILIAGRRGND